MLPEVDLPYVFIINNFVGGPRSEYAALVDDVGAVADAERLADVVVGNHHADPPILEEADDLLDVEHRERINPGERLVEENESRPRSQGACNLDAAALAAREAD